MIESVWRSLKRWRKVPLGPVSLVFSLRRRVRVRSGAIHHIEPRHRTSSEVEGHGELAVIVGVGPGFGYALATHLANKGYRLVLVCRNASNLSGLVEELSKASPTVAALGCDATDEQQVSSLFSQIAARFGVPTLVVYAIQEFGPGRTLDVSYAAFESAWRHNCLGAFLVGQAAGRAMVPLRRGSIFMVGSTSAMLGRAGHLNLAVGKFGQRALAQVLARELWPEGIHVAHIVIDADIDDGESMERVKADPVHLAYSVHALHQQPRTAWTSELDLRPSDERFWEHC